MNAGKNWITCPHCDVSYPPGDRTGHCHGCKSNFYGEAAWNAHRRGPHGPERHCIDPATDQKHKWRLDDQGRWRLGEPLSESDKKRIFGGRPDVQSFEEYLDKAHKSAESKRTRDALRDLKPGFTF